MLNTLYSGDVPSISTDQMREVDQRMIAAYRLARKTISVPDTLFAQSDILRLR